MGITTTSDAATTLPRLLIGFVLSALIGIVAYRRGSLTRSGVAGTVLVGTLVVGFGGWIAGILLVAFFVSSTALSHFKQNSAPKQRAAEQFEKGGTRDLGQVLANGGAAVICSVLLWTLPLSFNHAGTVFLGVMPEQWIGPTAAVVGALAMVNADTWATELGVLSRTPPRSIITFQAVEPGASGGISLAGTLAALSGAIFIAGLYWLMFVVANRNSSLAMPILIAATLGGFIGALFDSVLGATAQAIYFSQRRQKLTEKAFEADGTPNQHTRGLKWLNNDWVNFISSLVGAGVAVVIANLLI